MRIAGALAGHAYLQDYSQPDYSQPVLRTPDHPATADPIQADLDQLEAAIASGDFSGVRDAFEQLQKDVAAAQQATERKEREAPVPSPAGASVNLVA